MILLYHKVYLESPTEWWVDTNDFWRQMYELQNYEVVNLADYDPNNPEHVVITFDGVYENVFQYALPVLKSFGYPFELFVVGNTIGEDNTFDQHVEPPARFADRQQLKALVAGGGRLQWHSQSHIDLTKEEALDTVRAELSVPEDIRSLDPKGLKWFGYPYGNHDQRLLDITKEHFQGALSCVNGNDIDRYQFNRVIVTNGSSFARSTVSLIIANYNYGTFVPEAIESVLHQTIQPDEILFIDDCSTDNSVEIARRYEDKIKIVGNEKNLGIVGNFNKAVSLTSGDYICFLGADNRFRSDYVEKCKLALDKNKKTAIAYTYAAVFGPRAELLALKAKAEPAPDTKDIFLWRFPEFDRSMAEKLQVANFIHGSSMYRRQAFEEVGGYQKSEKPEDHHLFARIVSKGWDAVLVPEFTLEYRQHSGDQANTRLNTEMELAYTRKLLKLSTHDVKQLKVAVEGRLEKYVDLDKGVNSIRQLMNAGDVQAAFDLARKTLQQFPEQAKVIQAYAQIQALKGDLDNAEIALRSALLFDPAFAEAHNDLGSIYFRQDKVEEAIYHIEQAAKLKPDNNIILKNLAEIYETSGRIEDSLRTYQKLIELYPKDTEALMGLGNICQNLERLEDASFFYNRVLELEPKNPTARQNLEAIST